MENNKFADSFRNAFDGAEVLPSDAVWKNIELDLEKASGGHLKRNLLLFQLLAAASVAFALGVTALYYLDQPVTQQDSIKETLSKQEISPSPDLAKESIKESVKESTKNGTAEKVNPETFTRKNPQKELTNPETKNLANDLNENEMADQSLKEQPKNSTLDRKVARKELSAFIQANKPTLVLPKKEEEERVEPDAGMVLLAKLKDEEKRYQAEERKVASTEKMWASVGFGAGSYKPNRQVGMVNGASSAESTGESYSVGFNVAGKLSKRFIVQGGVSYLTQNANFTSHGSNQGTVTLSEFAKPANFDSFVGVNPYLVNSSMQFVSIPVQAGYLVIDHAFGLQLNGGIATDLFISNTLSPEDENYQKVTQAAGKDSPYRTVNFSGLLGTEVSYRITNHYRISLNPGLRYSLNSIYKKEVAAEITPVTVDVSLRFRYIFK